MTLVKLKRWLVVLLLVASLLRTKNGTEQTGSGTALVKLKLKVDFCHLKCHL